MKEWQLPLCDKTLRKYYRRLKESLKLFFLSRNGWQYFEMNIKKSVFLFLALLLPIVTFLFLKFFGKNEFTVEPLFQTAVQSSEECNRIEYRVPYTIADSILSKFKSDQDSITLLVFQDRQVAKQQEQIIQLNRIFKEFVNERMSVVKIVTDSSQENRSKEVRSKIFTLEDTAFAKLHNCVFLMGPLQDAVVLDKGNRIRGQYVMSNREDSDRLILELKILLKKY